MKTFVFPCGGVKFRQPEGDEIVIPLNVQQMSNVKLQIADISRAMVSSVPDLLLDLLEIAAYVYCADQRAGRGTVLLANAGSDWCREMHFAIPVRHPSVWKRPQVADVLAETLGFLSGDVYKFHFQSSSSAPAQVDLFFADLVSDTRPVEHVALFSGGLDSLAGAVELLAAGRKTALVGHASAPKVAVIQRDLVKRLKHRFEHAQFHYIPVTVTNAGVSAPEPTQRARSFLFASLAFVVARMFGLDRFSFFENGVVSINLPVARDVLGARATRTTHPKVIRGLEALFGELIGSPFTVSTPYLWTTKRQVVQRIIAAGGAQLIGISSSCTRPRGWTTTQRHCGICSQCIDPRRPRRARRRKWIRTTAATDPHT